MDANYWNQFAHEYDDYIIDAFTYGRNNTIAGQVERFASPDLEIADFGCGPGKILPLLSTKFRKVYAYDFSERLLNIARERCKDLGNVEIVQVDVSQSANHLPQVDVVISLNAAIMPDTRIRNKFLRGMASRIRPGGHLIFNVPSVESLLFSTLRETEWHRKKGYSLGKAKAMTDLSCLTQPEMMAEGVMFRGGELTKHYLREELIVLTKEEMGLELIEIVKMEYDWSTEFETQRVPDWMGEPYPWDWLVIARRNVREESDTAK